jgi:hypothetical protein
VVIDESHEAMLIEALHKLREAKSLIDQISESLSDDGGKRERLIRELTSIACAFRRPASRARSSSDADRGRWRMTPSGRLNRSGVEAPRRSRSIFLRRLRRRALPSSQMNLPSRHHGSRWSDHDQHRHQPSRLRRHRGDYAAWATSA